MLSRSVSTPPSYFCDKITYGVAILASFGFGGGQAYQMATQGASSQGLTGAAGITLALAVSTFAFVRSAQHQRAEQKPRDVESAPLLQDRVDYGTNLQGLMQKVDQIFRELQLPEISQGSISIQSPETQEQKIIRKLETLLQFCQSKQRIAEEARAEATRLRQQVQSGESTHAPASVETSKVQPETRIRRLERDLADKTADLESADRRIEDLEAIVSENELTASIFQNYIEQLEQQFKELTQHDTGQSPQRSVITGILSSMRKANASNTSRSQSANSSPRKKAPSDTPTDRRVSFGVRLVDDK